LYLFSSLFMFTRLYLILRWLYQISDLNSDGARFICGMANVEYTYSLLCKWLIREYDSKLMGAVFCTLMSTMAYSLARIESITCAYSMVTNSYAPTDHCVPMTLKNALWTLMLTITTVGYGHPYLPTTNGGRFVTVITGVSGMVMTAMAFSMIVMAFELSRNQAIVRDFLVRRQLEDAKLRAAVELCQSAYRYHTAYNRSVRWSKRTIGCGCSNVDVHYRVVAKRIPFEVKQEERMSHWRSIRKSVCNFVMSKDPMNEILKITDALAVSMEQFRETSEQVDDYYELDPDGKFMSIQYQLKNNLPLKSNFAKVQRLLELEGGPNGQNFREIYAEQVEEAKRLEMEREQERLKKEAAHARNRKKQNGPPTTPKQQETASEAQSKQFATQTTDSPQTTTGLAQSQPSPSTVRLDPLKDVIKSGGAKALQVSETSGEWLKQLKAQAVSITDSLEQINKEVASCSRTLSAPKS